MQPAGGTVGGWHQDGSGAFDFKKLGYPIPLIQLRASYLLTDQSVPAHAEIWNSFRAATAASSVARTRSARNRDDVPIGHVICAPGPVRSLIFHNAVWHRTFAHDGDYDRYTMHYVYSPPWVRNSDRLDNSTEFLEQTTELGGH